MRVKCCKCGNGCRQWTCRCGHKVCSSCKAAPRDKRFIPPEIAAKIMKRQLMAARRVLRLMLRRTSVALDGRTYDASSHIGSDVFDEAKDALRPSRVAKKGGG